MLLTSFSAIGRLRFAVLDVVLVREAPDEPATFFFRLLTIDAPSEAERPRCYTYLPKGHASEAAHCSVPPFQAQNVTNLVVSVE